MVKWHLHTPFCKQTLQTDRRTNGVTDKQTDRQAEGRTDWQSNKSTYNKTGKKADGRDGKTNRWTEGRTKTDRQKDRWADRAWFLRTCLKSFRTLGKCLFFRKWQYNNLNATWCYVMSTFENLVKYFLLARDSLTILKLANPTRLDYYLSVIKKLQL